MLNMNKNMVYHIIAALIYMSLSMLLFIITKEHYATYLPMLISLYLGASKKNKLKSKILFASILLIITILFTYYLSINYQSSNIYINVLIVLLNYILVNITYSYSKRDE